MTSEKDSSVSGIVMGDGATLSAKNVAVGDRATINDSSEQEIGIGLEISELRKLLEEAPLAEDDMQAAKEAVDVIEEEADNDSTTCGEKIKDALGVLEKLGKASSALVPLADRLFPILSRIAKTFF